MGSSRITAQERIHGENRSVLSQPSHARNIISWHTPVSGTRQHVSGQDISRQLRGISQISRQEISAGIVAAMSEVVLCNENFCVNNEQIGFMITETFLISCMY